eukprot:Blabericola_migrator_1__11957@NODE_731_length_6696_cov_64_725298_g527_i0_p2_GENE_NODE_731_length_6696_cov_64_725298_g527_i0NODE_731_length_6696_cov_64_725298_g527_i0_p2_ORF_typecomplete_len453_score74_38PCI/PF01399_27/1_7e07Cas6/PF09559_10/0_34Cas6/PF09559_10/7_2e03_NODE_731_length_6696_cov_64_725298_g527_i053366694
MASLGVWLQEVQKAFARHHHAALAWLFTPRRVISIPSINNVVEKKPIKILKAEEIQQLSITDITYHIGIYAPATNTQFQELLIRFVTFLHLSSAGNWEEAVEAGLNTLDVWVSGFRAGSLLSWTIPAFGSMCSFVVDVGEIADDQSQSLRGDSWFPGQGSTEDTGPSDADDTASSNTNLQKVLNGIRQHIGKFRGDETNQGAYMILLSESIRVCLKLRNVQMATTFLKTVPTNQPISPSAPRGPATKFKYYYGNLLLQQESFSTAEDPLAWSFSMCPSKNLELKRSILACLVAVRLRLGRLPPDGLLRQYNLDHYEDLIKATQTGDLGLFTTVMNKYATAFYQDGTTLCLDRVKFVVQRTLCQRTYSWALKHYFSEGQPTNIIPLGLFAAAFKWQVDMHEGSGGILFDEEEVMCVLANLIRLGYVRGYIAWQPRMLVLSKKAPFPPIIEGVT